MPRSGAGWLTAAIAAAVLLGTVVGLAAARAPGPAASSSDVLDIYQSPGPITEQDTFSVYLEVADAASVQQMYFTFCQLTNSLCYLPVTMTAQNGNWFTGTTQPMTAYHGMTAGIRAGYNITIVFTDNSTLVEPTVPNPFTNLTVAQSVTGENLFEMVVSNPVFGVSGTVVDSVTGHGVAGATVTLTPGNTTAVTTSATGTYAFAAVPNGTYTLSATKGGYHNASLSVSVAGQDVVKTIQMINASSAAPTGSGGGGSSLGFFGTPIGLGVIAAIVIGIVAVALVGRRLSRPRRDPSSAPGETTESPAGTSRRSD